MHRCDVCGEKGLQVYEFSATLAELNIKGTHAHIGCMLSERWKAEERAYKQGQRLGVRSSQYKPPGSRRAYHCR